MKVETISVKYLAKKDIKPDQEYVLGLSKVANNMNDTVKAYLGVIPKFSYYKTKGYFGMQTMLFDHVLDHRGSTYAISLSGKELLDNWSTMKKSKHPFAIVTEQDFKAYSGFLYNPVDTAEVRKDHNERWDYTCHNVNTAEIFAGESGAFRLPRHIARDLKSDRDWEMAKRARANWQMLEQNGILDNTVIHNN